MTQPVQEPSQGRTDQALEFRTRQLFRRPSSPPPTGITAALRGNHKYGVCGPEWDLVHAYNLWNHTCVHDITAPFSAYADLGNSNGNDVGFGCPLGPTNSLWITGLWYYKGPDYGKLTFEMTTTTVDTLTGTSGDVWSNVAILDPLYDPATWYTLQAPAFVDGYQATEAWAFNWFLPFWVAGPDGQQLSANGTLSATGTPDHRIIAGTSDMAAGGDESVYWWLRVRVDGKNASSSGYKAKVAGFQTARLTGTGFVVA